MAEIGIKFNKETEQFQITVVDFKQPQCLKTLNPLYIPAMKNDEKGYFAFLNKREQFGLLKKLVENL